MRPTHDRDERVTKAAWEAYLLVFRSTYNYLRRRSVSCDDAADRAEEATSHVMQKILERDDCWDLLKRLLSEGKLESYFRKSVFNRLKEMHRVQLRRPLTLFADMSGQAARVEEPDSDAIERVKECLSHAVTPFERELLELKYKGGLTDAEIADRILPHDARSRSARGQALRDQRLAAEAKVKAYLTKRGFVVAFGRVREYSDED